ncbi:MAG: hypothetical protein H6924_01325 [Alphaproteobacteria bacterium]|nr:hypothetical protein [Alphaproteobacteria bacterium]
MSDSARVCARPGRPRSAWPKNRLAVRALKERQNEGITHLFKAYGIAAAMIRRRLKVAAVSRHDNEKLVILGGFGRSSGSGRRDGVKAWRPCRRSMNPG